MYTRERAEMDRVWKRFGKIGNFTTIIYMTRNTPSMKPIKAKKSLGQNFLIDDEALTDIAHSIEIAGRHIIEV